MAKQKVVCQECGGRILFHRKDDQDMWVPISADGKVLRDKIIEGNPGGFSQWECENSEHHDIGGSLKDVLDKLFDDAQNVLI